MAGDGIGQIHELSEATGIPKERVIFDRGLSGYSKPAMERPGFARLYGQLQAHDVITVPDLSRLGRDAVDVLTVVKELERRDVGLVILSVGGAQVDTRTSLGKFFITMLAAIAELTRNQIADNTKLKLAALKAGEVYPEFKAPGVPHPRAGEPVVLGAKRKLSDAAAKRVTTMKNAGMDVADIAGVLGISERSVWRYLSRSKQAS